MLTYISMLFLPASFVTSLFGMEAVLPTSMNVKAFAMIFGLVCGLSYIIILTMGFGGTNWVLQTSRKRKAKAKMQRSTQKGQRVRRGLWKVGRIRRRKKSSDAEIAA
jgi:hypothetical protein